jgi:hypothetical protein
MFAPILLLLFSCAGTLNRMTVRRVIPALMEVPDLDLICRFGHSVVGGVTAATHKNPADKALILAYAASGICAEREARESRLHIQLAMENYEALGPARSTLARDARLTTQRLYALAARRYQTSWNKTVSAYGLDCAKMADREQILFLVGLVAGDLSLIADTASGSVVGVPQNTVLEAARAAECLDDDLLVGLPKALQAVAWATIPGTGPSDVDPWKQLDEAAVKGEAAGVRMGRSLQIFAAANVGNDELVRTAIAAHAAALERPASPEWALLDTFAYETSLFESDLLWIAATGHRTPVLGQFPNQSETADDPFGGDDPFGAAPASPPAPPQETPQ